MAEILFDLMICFKIETNDEIDTITNILNINPTDYILKGVSRSVVLEPAEKNVWMYDKKYRNCNSIETLLQNFFEDIPNLFSQVKNTLYPVLFLLMWHLRICLRKVFQERLTAA